MLAAALGVVAACSEPTFASLSPLLGQVYRADLTGAGVRPTAVTTSATGTFLAQLRDTAAVRDTLKDILVADSVTSVLLQLSVSGIGADTITAAHIHAGSDATVGGPIMLTLFTGTATGAPTAGSVNTNGVLNQRAISRATALTAPFNRDSLLVRLRNGTVYIDVHTRNFPAGLIRGQVRESEEPFPF